MPADIQTWLNYGVSTAILIFLAWLIVVHIIPRIDARIKKNDEVIDTLQKSVVSITDKFTDTIKAHDELLVGSIKAMSVELKSTVTEGDAKVVGELTKLHENAKLRDDDLRASINQVNTTLGQRKETRKQS